MGSERHRQSRHPLSEVRCRATLKYAPELCTVQAALFYGSAERGAIIMKSATEPNFAAPFFVTHTLRGRIAISLRLRQWLLLLVGPSQTRLFQSTNL